MATKRIQPLNKIFQVAYGNKFDLNKMRPASTWDDAIAFIGRAGRNNGVTAYVQALPGTEPYPAGLITVALGGAILSSFVQCRPFYTAQNIAVLAPIADMDLATKLFYCLCIRANLHRYGAFGREANRTLRTLNVPARAGIPKWVADSSHKVLEEWQHDLAQLAHSKRKG